VSRDKELYSSVMAVWKHAMKAMNDLILGRPQRINDGDVMLGLLSWHLYPDMTVLGVGTRTYHVPQQDGLIAPGGMITVGMGRREDGPDEAIYWSLPLAHMRFYGSAVNAERRHGLKDSQVCCPRGIWRRMMSILRCNVSFCLAILLLPTSLPKVWCSEMDAV
jgi:hypothetical protein